VSLGHLLDAEARETHLVSVCRSAGGYTECDRTGGDMQSGCGHPPEGPCSNRRVLFVQNVDKPETA